MEKTRLNKIGRLLQKELGDLFLKQANGAVGTLISVSGVRVSPDLSVARVYLSIFPSEKGAETLKAIEKNNRTVRYELGQRVHLQLRKIPELSFFLDDSLDYVEHIDELLKK
ncbi:MAG: 30S ribosome-binding factor RbfA [Tannerella sp.]|jgi:ribosome-binding factor A|nr:30S ribosome-binding factor RbfA [Tannerella sp.]